MVPGALGDLTVANKRLKDLHQPGLSSQNSPRGICLKLPHIGVRLNYCSGNGGNFITKGPVL